MRSRFSLIVAANLAMASSAFAGPMEDADAAYYAGEYDKAYKLVKPLADSGDAAAMNRLAVMYEMGRGVPADVPKAVALYRASADKGNGDAQNNLGLLHLMGTGVALDDKQALNWFKKAAPRSSHARTNLVMMYMNGKGTAPDPVKAYMYATLVNAPNDGGKDTSFLTKPNPARDGAAAKVTPAQVKAGEAKAKACFLSGYKACD